jgi:hypothetical protein
MNLLYFQLKTKSSKCRIPARFVLLTILVLALSLSVPAPSWAEAVVKYRADETPYVEMEVSDMVECVAAQEGEKRYKEEFEKAEAALERALDAVEAEKKKTKFFSDIVLVCIIADAVLPIVGFLIGRATR